MRSLSKKAWVVYYSWLTTKPSWTACFIVDRGVGRYILFQSKSKALEYARIRRQSGVITKIKCWEEAKK